MQILSRGFGQGHRMTPFQLSDRQSVPDENRKKTNAQVITTFKHTLISMTANETLQNLQNIVRKLKHLIMQYTHFCNHKKITVEVAFKLQN